MVAPLMPKATAVWLVENTALSFDQIADFCKLHPLEVKAIADGDAAQGIKGLDPVQTGQLSREEIEKAEADPDYRLKLPTRRSACPRPRRRRARATRRCRAGRTGRMRSSGWCAIIPSSRTARSCGWSAPPSRPSQSIRERTHWNAANLQPMDPVTLGLCSQIDLDLEVHRAAKEKPVDAEPRRARRCCRPPRPRSGRASPSRKRRSRRASSTSTRSSPSSSRSAARTSSYAAAFARILLASNQLPSFRGAPKARARIDNHRRWLSIPGSLAALGPRNDTGREGQRRHVR